MHRMWRLDANASSTGEYMNETTLMVLRIRAQQNGIANLEETIVAMNGLQEKALSNKDDAAARITGHALWWLLSIVDLDPRKPPVRGWPEL